MAALIGLVPTWLALVGLSLTQAAQVPQSQTPTVTVDVSPNPAFLNQRVVFTARISSRLAVPLVYRFYVDGQIVCNDWQDSPACSYVPKDVGRHYVHVEVRAAARPQPDIRAAPQRAILSSPRQPFDVRPPVPTVLLSLKLASRRVVVGDAAVFEVSVEGGRAPPSFVFDAGDRSPRTLVEKAQFTHIYQRPGAVTASVSPLPGVAGRGASVSFDVEPLPPPVVPSPPPSPPPAPPITLTLQLVSSDVAPGEAAAFVVSVQGAGAMPRYVFEAGDGSAPETRGDRNVSHVYARAGRYSASISVPPGVAGTGSSVSVVVSGSSGLPPWVYVAAVLLAIVGAYVAGRAGRKPPHPHVAATLHPRPSAEVTFDPARPRGVSLEVRLVPNLGRMRFTPRLRIGREE